MESSLHFARSILAHDHAHPVQTMSDQKQKTGTFAVKAGMAQMLKGGVIMDVVDVEQARIAEEAGVMLPGAVCSCESKDDTHQNRTLRRRVRHHGPGARAR